MDPAPPVGPAYGSGARPKILVGIAVALAIAIGAYELGRTASAPPPLAPAPRIAATALPARAATRASPVAQSTDELIAASERARPSPQEERSVTEVTIARPEPAPTPQPSRPEPTAIPETPHDKMARCLTFRVETDEVHYGSYSPLLSPVKVTVTNACAFSFEGADVSVEVRAFPLHGEGSIARNVGQFQEPIPSRGSTETQMLLACQRCDAVSHRFEVRLLP